MRAFAFGALAALALAGSAMAAEPTSQGGLLTLKENAGKSQLILDGAIWKCLETTCRSAKVKAVPAERACRQLAAKLGELTAFSYRGQDFSPETLAACNTAAKGA